MRCVAVYLLAVVEKNNAEQRYDDYIDNKIIIVIIRLTAIITSLLISQACLPFLEVEKSGVIVKLNTSAV